MFQKAAAKLTSVLGLPCKHSSCKLPVRSAVKLCFHPEHLAADLSKLSPCVNAPCERISKTCGKPSLERSPPLRISLHRSFTLAAFSGSNC